MKKHKGQVSSSFTYLFALIIGGIVFMFLIGFAYKFLGFAGSLSAAELVSSLNDEFAAFSAVDSAEKSLEFSQKVEFRVYQGALLSKGQSKTIDHAIFAPFEISGKSIYIATKSLEIPYRIGNLFYITDGKTMYILVSDAQTESVVQELESSYNSIPSIFPRQSVSTSQLSVDMETLAEITASYEHVRFLFFSSSEPFVETIGESFSSFEILEVQSSVEDYSSGEVEFPDGNSAVYIGYPLLMGAMIAEDSSSYSYTFAQVMEKTERVTGVYYEKAKLLSSRLPECDYTSIKTSLNNYNVFLGSGENYDSYPSFLTKIELVEDANQNLGGECPEIY